MTAHREVIRATLTTARANPVTLGTLIGWPNIPWAMSLRYVDRKLSLSYIAPTVPAFLHLANNNLGLANVRKDVRQDERPGSSGPLSAEISGGSGPVSHACRPGDCERYFSPPK